MIISILVDNKNSWVVPYAEQLKKELVKKGHDAALFHQHEEVKEGDCAFFLGCEKIVKKDILNRNTHNIVVHESALPLGKGWSPLTWQILEGRDDIPITLFEAREELDSGEIYLQDTMIFEGNELNAELKNKQGEKTAALCLKFVEQYPHITGRIQSGNATFYPRRTAKDSELDINKTIAEQFNLLRVVDNERYPAFFRFRNHKYTLKIYKEDNKV